MARRHPGNERVIRSKRRNAEDPGPEFPVDDPLQERNELAVVGVDRMVREGEPSSPPLHSFDGLRLAAMKSFPIPIFRLDLTTGARTRATTIDLRDSAGVRFVVPAVTPDGKHWGAAIARLLADLYVVTGLK